MKISRRLLATSLLAALALAAPLASAGDAPRPGAFAPAFSLPNAAGGAPVALKDLLAGKKAAVVIFVATKCPVSNAYDGRMAELAAAYSAKGIAFAGVNSNKTEPAAEVVEHAKRKGLGFPVLKDEGNKVADLYGATKTPEVFVVDPSGKIVYHGRIDENQDDPKGVKSPDLKNALEALLAGRPVPAPETKAFGCSIKRV